jgi:predicted DNA-binding transcriptional regulator AlpA
MSDEGAVRFLSARDLAHRYSVHVITIWKWTKKGVLPPPLRLGANTTRWRETDIDAHEARCEERGRAKQIKPTAKTTKRQKGTVRT